MATIYHDDDADVAVLSDETLAVIGYGNQGRSQALNLRDAGLSVIVGSRADASADEVGMLKQMDFHSQTSQYGSITRSANFADLVEPLKERMGRSLASIRSGAFAEEWSGMRERGAEILANVKAARDQLPLAEWERSARTAFSLD